MNPVAVKQLYDSLQRYAGWLNRERTSFVVRADVQALGNAIDTCADPSLQLQALETNIRRLPGGELRKMLRAATDQIRHALAEPR